MNRLSKLYIILGLVLLSNSLFAQAKIQASLDKNQVIIGDQFSASIRIAAPAGSNFSSVLYETWEDEGVELLDIKPMLTSSTEPELIMEQKLLLTSFDTGYHRLPALEVVYELNGVTDTISSNALNLNVNGLKVQEDAPIRDNKDIVKEPVNWRDFAPYVIAFLLIGLIFGIIWKLANKEAVATAVPPPPPVPAHKVALQKLAELRTEALWKKGEIKAFQSQLTYVFREYLENRFGIHALEATTTEITGQLANTDINPDQQTVLKEILETADMVKFAKAVPPEEIHSKALDTINDFVVDTQTEIIEEPEKKEITE